MLLQVKAKIDVVTSKRLIYFSSASGYATISDLSASFRVKKFDNIRIMLVRSEVKGIKKAIRS